MKKILVTGGCGFIGSNFIRHLISKYPTYHIFNLDKLTYAGNVENLADIAEKGNYTFIQGDICNHELVGYVLKNYGINYVVNFAAESHVDRSIADAGIFIRTNVEGTRVLIDSAKKFGIERYMQISTDEVYGSLGREGRFTEESPLAPNNPYAASKAAADLLVLSYYHTYGLPVLITRCTNNYGPYQHPEKLIPLMILNALCNRELPLYGDGKNIRDWIHVSDHCRAIDVVLHRGRTGEVYNIGGNNERENIEIVKVILAGLGKDETLITFVKDRPGHDRRYAMDAAKICRELGWQPVIPFTQGLEKTIKWYVEHASWWKRILSCEVQEGEK
jgi:dTDP-glucose 4,6-dehydratase